jgi:hypothetical protein
MTLLQRLNPTSQILQASTFCKHHEYIFALLCLLNVNMGALDLSKAGDDGSAGAKDESFHAHSLLHDLATLFNELEPSAQARVYKRVVSSGSLPISRDTPSYVAVMSVLHGGAAGQLEYVIGKGDSKGGEGEDEDYRDMRGEAKQAHLDRMAAVSAQEAGGGSKGSDSPTTVEIPTVQPLTLSDKERAEEKENAPERISQGGGYEDKKQLEDRQERYRLLGALPSLGPRANEEDVKVALALELPTDLGKAAKNNNSSSTGPANASSGPQNAPEGVPKEYLCAINGHVMQDPVRSPSGTVYEKATIELWLSTRGSICPITHEALTKEDLIEDKELRNQIKRYFITQVTRPVVNDDDDLYDF